MRILKLHNSFSDITPLAGLTNLVNLELNGNRITDISSLSKLTQLTELRLEENLITNISPLAKLTNLTTLRLHNNQIGDLTPLSDMTNLLLLELHRNKIQDVAPLAGMTKLKGLFLGGNEITDITPLEGLTELTHLGLVHNDIKDIRVIDNFKLLEHISVKQNPIQDFTPLDRIREHNPELHQPTRDKYYRETSGLGTVFARHETRTGLPINAIARFGKGGINVMQFSPDGTQLVVGTDIGVRIYEVTTGNEKELASKINAQVNAITFSHNGRILAIGGASNPVIQLWDMQTDDAFPPIPVTSNSRVNGRPIRSVAALAFSNDNATLISLNGRGLVNYWDITQSNNIPKVETYTYGNGDAYALKSDGSMFATGTIDGKIELWNTSGGEIKYWGINRLKQTKPEATLKGHSRFLGNFKLFRNKNKSRGKSEIITLTFSPDGNTLASGSKDTTVRLWDANRRKKINTLEGHTGWVTSVVFSRDGRTLASGDTEGILRLWRTENGKELATLNGHRNTIVALTFTPDGNTLASASADGTIRFWDTNSGDETSIFATGHTESVKSVAFSADGSTLSSAMFNGTVQKYDVTTQKELSTFTANHQNLTEEIVLSSDASFLASQRIDGRIAFNVKGLEIKKKYYSNRNEGSIKLWNLIIGEELTSLSGSYNMSFSPNNNIFATRTSQQIELWDMKQETNLSSISLNNDTFLFSPDREIFVIGINHPLENTEIWDIETRQILGTLERDHNPVAFSLDGTILACKRGYNYFIWDLTIPEEPLLIG